MKTCPVCKQNYENDEQRFCGNDGATLVEQQTAVGNGNQTPPNAEQFVAQPSAQTTNATTPIVGTGKKRSWFGSLVGGLTGKPPQATVEVDRPNNSYRAGETVRARIKITAPDAVGVNQIYAGLLFEESCLEANTTRDSEGDRDTVYDWKAYPKWITQQQLAGQTELPAGFEQTFEFAYQIPADIRPTYAGKIARLNTKVHVYIDRPAASDITAEASVPIVAPFAEQEEPIRDFIRVSAPDSNVQIGIWLPKLNYRQGETVTGRVCIEPRGEIKVRSISLAHNRREVTTGGDETNSESWSGQKIQLAGESVLQAGKMQTFDFQIALPANDWKPTFRTQLSRSEASLDINLDVPWGKDFNASQQIYIHAA